MLVTIEPGLYGTIQDLGRRGAGHLGVRQAGAADELALIVANLLVGNTGDAAALEMTLLGGTFAVQTTCLVGITGADMEARLEPGGRQLRPGRSYWLDEGTTLVFGGAVDGARAYLSLAGGIASEVVLDSASTDPIAGFGGIGGRSLLAGDVLAAPQTEHRPERTWPSHEPSSGVATSDDPRAICVVRGPHLDMLPDEVGRQLSAEVWTVSPRSDRVGLRLDGQAIDGGELPALVSLPMLPGAVQLPASGLPIVLMPDAPTVGGYPVPAVVASIDRPVTGQLRPGDEARFEWLEPEAARALAAQRDARLGALASGAW